MLKALSSSCFQGRLKLSARFPAAAVNVGEGRSPLLRVLGSLTSPRGGSPVFWRKAFFCSERDDGSEPAEAKAEEESEATAEGGGAEEADSKASSAIVSMNPRPEDYLSDPKLLAALVENRKRSVAYAGAFLLKDEPEIDVNVASGETDKSVYDLKGKELFKRLHEVGTLAQITSIQGDQVVLIGHRRLRITEMEEAYNKDDDIIKATAFEVISTLRDVLKTIVELCSTARHILLGAGLLKSRFTVPPELVLYRLYVPV
ncbi:hypothetical protein B296_00041899 [Ensete ventricosum]|uniref:Lon N-terminal domain-containing protein n=1 Tax=Ensete ventricosum TaxID=4639 RepID=A0A426ZK40_ENSVE|nr:hypothetical protein B296_00041899 [Ensete ventricosum]